MAEIKAEPSHHRPLIISQPDISDPESPHIKTKRLASLDIFRGLTVALMILVDDAGGEWPLIAHAPWNGCNLADFVMPFFLFIVGVAIALALKRIPSQLEAVKKVILRTLKLLFWGILLQGGFSHAPDKLTYGVDVTMIRWCGILQRIALAYLIVALVEIFTKDAQDKDRSPMRLSIFRLVGACVLIIYLAIIYGTYVPDWQFTIHNKDSADFGKVFNVSCGVRGKLDPPCNAVGYVDRKVLGINHMYHHPAWRRSKACTEDSPYEGPLRIDAPSWCHAPFEPEGILSSISAILSTIIGVHFGHVLIHLKSHLARLKHWVSMGLGLLILGLTLHFTHAIPLNKQLFTFSYVCVTAGSAALVFSAIYALVDIWEFKFIFLPFEWIGMNAMLVYVMAAEGIFAGFINGWYYEDPHNTLIYWIQKHVFIGVWRSRRVGTLLYVVFAEILFWALIAGILHRFGVYWKL
ncbi:heparan-alpha-glucosaminide N-acetyltransferase isoform X2 [Mangifera indica]|uniref:heparan-alpha-glucosaminide N-acetyltransferase isoform X2 n=1 Tax=Mangifera indica TaxID=29780 RepID=UPI001CFB9B22|nr:heparan-alpha-glucosaminide N-acetyltransferase isoform X2 [Mangifera indica]